MEQQRWRVTAQNLRTGEKWEEGWLRSEAEADGTIEKFVAQYKHYYPLVRVEVLDEVEFRKLSAAEESYYSDMDVDLDWAIGVVQVRKKLHRWTPLTAQERELRGLSVLAD